MNILNIQPVRQYAKELKEDYPKLTEFETLKLAIEMQRNEIFRAAFNVSSDNSHPSALEALAIVLGFQPNLGCGNVADALTAIASSIENK